VSQESDILIEYQRLRDKLDNPKTLDKLQDLKKANQSVIDALAEVSDHYKKLRIVYESRLEAQCALRAMILKDLGEDQ
jgi:hypothetical protein